ncbi:hypothetical protein LXL04_009872 [Taraxacum kok-saghyz]
MEAIESQSQSQEQDSRVMSEDAEGKILIEHESLHNLSINIQITVIELGIAKESESRKLVTEDVGKYTDKISDLEKEAVSLWEQILDLTDENGLLEAEKGKVADLNLVISESNGKIETMGKVIEGLKEQVLRAQDEISKLKEELSTKVILNTQAKESELQEQISLGLSEIAKRDAQITELNARINQQKISLVDDLNQKHEALMSCTDELKQRVAELERAVEVISEEKREAIRQLSVSLDHYMSKYK